MDTALHSIAHQPTDGPRAVPAVQTMAATAVYHLSETGRKASLLAGGNGKGIQRRLVQVPVTRLHLVSVGTSGHAKLKLQPRFERVDGHVVRHEAPPVYDAAPTVDDLLRQATINYELSREYQSPRAQARETYLERRAQTAREFLDDPTQRAMTFPPPNPARCYINTAAGRFLFERRKETGLARDVPREAYRRFLADAAARRAQGQRRRAEADERHAERTRLIAEWVARHGTDDQRRRFASGALPIAEVIDGMTAEAFAPVAGMPLLPLDGAARLQAHVREVTGRDTLVISPAELAIEGETVTDARAGEWAVMEALRSRLPDAEVVLRQHRLSWKCDPSLPAVCVYGALATRRVGPIALRREFAVPGR